MRIQCLLAQLVSSDLNTGSFWYEYSNSVDRSGCHPVDPGFWNTRFFVNPKSGLKLAEDNAATMPGFP
jgi:hypothetical protein